MTRGSGGSLAFAAEARLSLASRAGACPTVDRTARQPAPCVVVDRAEYGLGRSIPEVVRLSSSAWFRLVITSAGVW